MDILECDYWYCLCEKCEYFCYKEDFDFDLSLCSLCKEEEIEVFDTYNREKYVEKKLNQPK